MHIAIFPLLLLGLLKFLNFMEMPIVKDFERSKDGGKEWEFSPSLLRKDGFGKRKIENDK